MRRPLLILLAFGLAAVASADLKPEAIRAIDQAVAKEMENLRIPGVSIAVGIGGVVEFTKGYGMADLENGVKVNKDTVFRTASIAKPLTATAVMQLFEQGKLDLDASIQTYVPDYPAKEWPVLVRQILSHTSGIRHYKTADESVGTKHYFTLKDTLPIFKDDGLLFEPDTKLGYSTFAYTLLGLAVENVSKLSFRDYMQKNVFAKAGMARTRYDDHFFLIPNRSRGYARLNEAQWKALPDNDRQLVLPGDVVNAELHDTSMKIPGGGFLSTSGDLSRFGLAMINDKLMAAATKERMWTKVKLKDGLENSYGLGWSIGTIEGKKLIQHSGGQAGTATLLYIVPEKKLAISIMCNLEGAKIGPMMRAIGSAVWTN